MKSLIDKDKFGPRAKVKNMGKEAIEVFWASGSPFSWRVLLALEAKEIEYVSRLLEFSKGQLKAPEFLALNPRGKVPVVKMGNVVVYESMAILAYLDRQFPKTPLFGQTPQDAGTIWRLCSECMSYLEGPVMGVTRPLFSAGAENKGDEIRAAAEKAHAELVRLERFAASAPWLAGDALSAADIAVFPILMTLSRAASKEAAKPFQLGLEPLADRYPALEAWRGRIEAIPGYERTYPPHWREKS